MPLRHPGCSNGYSWNRALRRLDPDLRKASGPASHGESFTSNATFDMTPDPDQLVMLTSTRTEFEARSLAAALEAEGIEVRVFAAAASGVSWEGGISNAVKVMVRRADLPAAGEAMHAMRRWSRAIDWSQVDVGEPEEEAAGEVVRTPGRGGMTPVWRYRVRTVGFVLIVLPMMVGWIGAGDAWLAVALCAVLIVGAWKPPEPDRPERGEVTVSVLPSASPENRGSA